MISPKLVTAVAIASLLLCLTGCIGFSTGSKTSSGIADFSVNISPGSANIDKGGNSSVTASIAALGGFSGTVQLMVTGAPAGVTANLSASSVNGSGSPTISVSVAKTATPGTYPLTLWAASGNLSHSANLSLVVANAIAVPDFSISASPGSQTIGIGQGASFSVSVVPVNEFTGTVSLTASGLPSGMQASFVPASITTSGTATLNISTSSSAAAGTYTLTIGGASGSISHTTSVSVTLTANAPPPDFSISEAPSSQTVTAGNSTSVVVSVAGSNGFTGTVALAESGMPAGMTASCNPASITGSASCTLNISTTSSTAAGTYTVTITGTSGALTHNTSVKVIVVQADFSISAAPSSQTVTAGNSTSFTVSVGASNGFNGTVGLVESGMPAGMLVSCSPASITGSGSCTLNVSTTSSTAAGTYTLTITGTSGSLTHSTSVSVKVQGVTLNPDFSISVSPGSETVTAGNSTTYITSVAAQNGFTGTVALSVTGLPTGVTANFVPGSINTSGGSTLTLKTASSTTAGNYPLTITGSSGSLMHSTNATLIVSSAATGVLMQVVIFPGQQEGTDSAAIQQYLINNPPVTLGATIAIQWSSADNGTGSYDWSVADGEISPWIAAGHKVNLAIWANSDGSGTGSCGPEGQYGTPNIGNCAIPTYIWNALGSSNYVTCNPANASSPQQMPNYMDGGGIFMTNYKKFIAGVVSHYSSNANIGYIRVGLGRGGETIPVADWDNTAEACGQSYVNTWGYTVANWDSNYIGPMLQYEGSLITANHLPVSKLMVGITPMGGTSQNQNANFTANTAVPLGMAFGSQGLQESDVQNYPSCGANWCNLFATYTGQVTLELQTVAQSCLPGASCTTQEQGTGPLTDLIPFAVTNHVTSIELYYQDWLTAFDPNYTPYDSTGAYATVIRNAAGQ